MKTLTLEEAKKLALKIAPQINPVDQREFFLIHSEKVGQVAKIIGEKLGLDTAIFEIAGRVHDIGYAKDLDHHAQYGLSMLEEEGYEINDILKDCILNHGINKTPETSEGKIFQIADKLSIFDKDIIKLLLKQGTFPPSQNDIDFLRKTSETACRLLENY